MYILRYCSYGLQLLKYGKIIDITDGNQYWYEIENSEKILDWNFSRNWMKNHHQEIYSQVNEICDKILNEANR